MTRDNPPTVGSDERRAVAERVSAMQPTDEGWKKSVEAYLSAGWDGNPDDYDRMFWEAGYRAGRDDAVRITRGETKGDENTPDDGTPTDAEARAHSALLLDRYDRWLAAHDAEVARAAAEQAWDEGHRAEEAGFCIDTNPYRADRLATGKEGGRG